ncbi:MAG: hypothetical protein AAGB32_02045 [Pseudomonadota bacterium]
MEQFALRIGDVIKSPAQIARESFEASVKASREFHEKLVHSMWEKISDDVHGTAIGRIRKRFQKRKESGLGFLFKDSPGLFGLLIDDVTSQEPIIDLKPVVQHYFGVPHTNTAFEPEQKRFFNRIGDVFQRAINNTVQQFERVMAPLDVKFEVAVRDAKNVVNQSFIGPLTPPVAAAFNNFQAGGISQNEFEARVLEASGFEAVPNASNHYRLASEIVEELSATFGRLGQPAARGFLSQYTYCPDWATPDGGSITRIQYETPEVPQGSIPNFRPFN